MPNALRSSYRSGLVTLGATLVLVVAPVLATAQEPSCKQDHPGRQHRMESVAKRGDARMAWSAGAHATVYAIERFGLQGQFSQAEIKRAQDGMYKFLQWKLGSPTTVAAQFIGAGYQHFDRAYSDEAAAILLGMIDFSTAQAEIVVPAWMLAWMKDKVGGQATVDQVAGFLESEVGIQPPVSDQIAEKAVAQLAKLVPEQLSVYMPKQYDVENREVRAFIAAKQQYASSSQPATRPTPTLPGPRRTGGRTRP